MTNFLSYIREDLKSLADPIAQISGKRFFKEDVSLYGVKTHLVKKLARHYLSEIKYLPKSEIFTYCEELWKSGYLEESFIACHWAESLHKQYSPDDFIVFEKWVASYVTNWASCDTLCNHSIGTFITMYPEYIKKLRDWTHSSNRWVRRASCVSLIVPARKGKFLKDIFELSDLLLSDNDDMVQKGYGWMLKSASAVWQDEVFRYVMRNKERMPRTALRYAIEKMPQELKTLAMKKHMLEI
jgi:3-methyladenine DNA glycosylase AlkD